MKKIVKFTCGIVVLLIEVFLSSGCSFNSINDSADSKTEDFNIRYVEDSEILDGQ